MRRKFKRGRCLKGHEKEIQEEKMSQSLREGNSRGADISVFTFLEQYYSTF